MPDLSSNITHLMNHIKNEISALGDPLPSLGYILGKWFSSGGSWFKSLLMTLLLLLAILIVFCIVYRVIIYCAFCCIYKPASKIMMSTRLETIDHMYSFI